MLHRTLRYCLVVIAASFMPSHGFLLHPPNRVGSLHHPICDPSRHPTTTELHVSSGFSFNDGQQILVSAQKPLGIILEEQQDDDDNTARAVVVRVVNILPASPLLQQGVVRVGDVMLAVQNMNVRNQSLEQVMAAIAHAPRVVNLRFQRQEQTTRRRS